MYNSIGSLLIQSHQAYCTMFNLFYVVTCQIPPGPMNGMLICSMEDNGVLFYEDICTVTCDTGYMLTGDDTRTCQTDGMLNGTEAMCNRGKLCTCFLTLCN